jgi:hypothetical protein
VPELSQRAGHKQGIERQYHEARLLQLHPAQYLDCSPSLHDPEKKNFSKYVEIPHEVIDCK